MILKESGLKNIGMKMVYRQSLFYKDLADKHSRTVSNNN
jgi:hypothetical protein